MAKPRTPTKKKTATTRAPAKRIGASLVDKALKARFTEALTRLREARASEASSWDAEYEALGDIIESDPPYYLAGGFKTAREFLVSELPGVDERTARRSIRVARYFDPDDEAKHGISKLEALLDYLEATGGVPLAPAKIHLERQMVKVRTNKSLRSRPFAEVSVADMRAATRLAKSGKTDPKRASPAVKAVRAALGAEKLGEVAVSIHDNRITVSGIPVGRLAAAGRALTRAKV